MWNNFTLVVFGKILGSASLVVLLDWVSYYPLNLPCLSFQKNKVSHSQVWVPFPGGVPIVMCQESTLQINI